MTENQHLAVLLRHLRKAAPKAVIFKHADARTTGVPDFSLTLHGHTSWWEAKKIRGGKVIGTGLQHQFMRELAVEGRAWYVVWDEKCVGVVEPKCVKSDGSFTWHAFPGTSIISLILDLHGGPRV